ncbi:NLI interacting factor-like phosphatase-domain-containing protein [Durotheca rogersii]|uniref:NLI interacting factor-like phosphatase-domain-containing protein n=1 Tax=Durotheca rogersii TaxID=419775 RepID=UPI00221EAB09|nr:NLI interacting factor-like phosphatase-domain-containing protein [Durotheca rogersii]KAI5860162.1 NLI interacting factor-like phosphatase-domain-containing protein [Durotheca rogersii]
MNSLNIISTRVSPPSSPAPSRSNSLGHIGLAVAQSDGRPIPSEETSPNEKGVNASESNECTFPQHDPVDHPPHADEKTPLLESNDTKETSIRTYWWHVVPSRIATGFIDSIRWVLSTLATPGVYLVAYFYDDQGDFAPLRQLGSLFGTHGDDTRKLATDLSGKNTIGKEDDALSGRHPQTVKGKKAFSASRPLSSPGTSSSGLSSDSETDMASKPPGTRRSSASSGRHTRSKSADPTEDTAPTRRSIRIKLNNEELMRQRKHKKARSTSATGSTGGGGSSDLSAQLKSPTSPIGALTRYPKTPAPPRPLIPRRQPSYLPFEPLDPKHLKTLILDLDETLIHSMSKGGRMGSGHMVEVRLNTTYVGSGGQQSLGPQHPILYYVHKRPHCDEFLRKVCKWFNLVIFTASVQEYADPVIDWLESERKFFSGRYYRQHCTFRHGAFIKDLSSIEPDLSRVMILDNSPLSYMFHQDNAIPIQGWINDPTDNDLLHLVPLLEGLQYVSDVRALLALRGGEDGQHMMT